MRHICLYFQVHQPFRLRIYRFFDIGVSQDYYHELNNRALMRRIAQKSYLPMNALLRRLIERWGPERFSVSFALSGVALEQMRLYAPEGLESFQALYQTGGVELVGETYAHSLACLRSRREFEAQVRQHADTLQALFSAKPTTFRNTELVYYDEVAKWVSEMGFSAMLAEGADTLLGWRSQITYTRAPPPQAYPFSCETTSSAMTSLFASLIGTGQNGPSPQKNLRVGLQTCPQSSSSLIFSWIMRLLGSTSGQRRVFLIFLSIG